LREPYEAIFFDRDGTLSRNSPQKARRRDQAIGQAVGRPNFSITPEMYEEVFWRVMHEPTIKPVNTLDRESSFWQRWYQLILEDLGARENSGGIASRMYRRFPFHRMMGPFPEVPVVLKILKRHGFRLGVISDTFPSLEESLKAMHLARYFDSFTASSIVGAGKPDPAIFRAATQSLGVAPQDCIFVDDCREEAEGAREQGFTAFHLDRGRGRADLVAHVMASLEDVLGFLGLSTDSAPPRRRSSLNALQPRRGPPR